MSKGKAFLLKTGNGASPVVYSTVAGLRVINEEIGRSGYLVCASGIFLSSAAEAQVRANALAGTLDDYELSFEGGEKLRGQLLVMKLDYQGDFNSERNYRITLSGKVQLA